MTEKTECPFCHTIPTGDDVACGSQLQARGCEWFTTALLRQPKRPFGTHDPVERLRERVAELEAQNQRLREKYKTARYEAAAYFTDAVEAHKENERLRAEIGQFRETLKHAGNLIEITEGPFGWSQCRNTMELRLKDSETYVQAYLAIRDALRTKNQ